jgi:hypothetical protein
LTRDEVFSHELKLIEIMIWTTRTVTVNFVCMEELTVVVMTVIFNSATQQIHNHRMIRAVFTW